MTIVCVYVSAHIDISNGKRLCRESEPYLRQITACHSDRQPVRHRHGTNPINVSSSTVNDTIASSSAAQSRGGGGLSEHINQPTKCAQLNPTDLIVFPTHDLCQTNTRNQSLGMCARATSATIECILPVLGTASGCLTLIGRVRHQPQVQKS